MGLVMGILAAVVLIAMLLSWVAWSSLNDDVSYLINFGPSEGETQKVPSERIDGPAPIDRERPAMFSGNSDPPNSPGRGFRERVISE